MISSSLHQLSFYHTKLLIPQLQLQKRSIRFTQVPNTLKRLILTHRGLLQTIPSPKSRIKTPRSPPPRKSFIPHPLIPTIPHRCGSSRSPISRRPPRKITISRLMIFPRTNYIPFPPPPHTPLPVRLLRYWCAARVIAIRWAGTERAVGAGTLP